MERLFPFYITEGSLRGFRRFWVPTKIVAFHATYMAAYSFGIVAGALVAWRVFS